MPPGERPGATRVIGLLGPPILLMVLIFVLSAQPNLNSGLKEDFFLRKCAHVTEYAVLTVLWARAIAGLTGHRAPPGGRPIGAWLVAPGGAVLIAVLWAASDEWHQTFVRGRVGAVHDVGIDAIGMVIAVVLVLRTRVGVVAGVRRGPGR